MARRRNFSRAKQKVRIAQQFALWQELGKTDKVTLHQVAKALEMSPSPFLRDILLEMVDEGILGVEWRDRSGRWTTRFFYPVAKLALQRKSFVRRIAVNVRGREAGQLELAL